MRLRKEQDKARRDEVFGGLSLAEKVDYDKRTERVHQLESEAQTGRAVERGSPSGMTATAQRRQWNTNSETDMHQSDPRQPYSTREKDSGNAFTDSLKTDRGKRKNDSKEGSE